MAEDSILGSAMKSMGISSGQPTMPSSGGEDPNLPAGDFNLETFQSPTTTRMTRVEDEEALESFDPELEAQLQNEEAIQRQEAIRLKEEAEATGRRLQEEEEVLATIQCIKHNKEWLKETERL